jgi:hypothetical protein
MSKQALDMKMRMAWFALVIPLLLVGSVAAYSSQSQSVSLTMAGGVVSPGVQTYSIQGGQLVSASISGTPVNPGSSFLRYDLSAIVSGTAVTGTASFDLVTQTSHRARMEMSGTFEIEAMADAVFFPLGCSSVSGAVTFPAGCLGEIPAMFIGIGTVTVWNGSSVTTAPLIMGFESAYLNPFGGPIFFNSSQIVVAADYSRASIQWTDVQMGGSVVGTVSGTPVSGSFGMLVNSSEDLRFGQEMDHGLISFFGMSNPALDASGYFFGHSTIPMGSSLACPGFPTGTCYETGLQSYGFFFMNNELGGALVGQYATTWSTPAVLSSSTVSAFLTSPHNHH